MNVETIKLPRDQARAKFDEYAEALKTREATAEDSAALLGYKALAAGKDVLDLHRVFRDSEGDEKRRPRFAVARAHWSHVALRAWESGAAFFQEAPDLAGYVGFGARLAWHRRIRLPPGTLHESARPRDWREAEPRARAVVPIIPPAIRPPRALYRYVILWEADWKEVPTDPLLLRQLAGPLYVVLAQWDLTELERSILAARG